MGEGWSDFMALTMTVKPGDTGPTKRGVGTYVFRQPNNGEGLRRFPYSTDMSISPLTFAGSSSFGIGTGNPYKLTVGTITSTTSAPFFNVVVDRTTTPGTDYTQIESTGSADLRGLDFWTHGFNAPFGTTITPLRTASGITSLPTRYPEGSYYDAWRISYATNGGRDMTWTFVGQVPVIIAVSPSTSTVAGGGLLTITGAQFYGGTEVTVGGAACTNPTRITSNTVTCTLPAHAAGAADVTVTNVSRSATLVGAITYEKPITPSTDTAGTPTGGTTTRTLTIGTPRVVGTKLVTTITAPGAGVITQTAVTGAGRKAMPRCRVNQRLMIGVTDTGLVKAKPTDSSTPKAKKKDQGVSA
jgi:hypothetical protein